MRNRNIKFGTYEYGRLSDEGKLMVIKNQISNLIDNNSGRTVGIMYNGKLRRVPFDNQKEISSMIEAAKALKKKCKTNIEIFDDSKEFTMTFIDSSNRRVIENYNVNETGNEIIIDIPKTENKSKEIKYTEDKYNLVFKDFFKQNVDAKVSKDDYKIVLDDSLDEKQKESYDVFDLDLDSFFEMKAPSEEYELTDEKLTYKKEHSFFKNLCSKLKGIGNKISINRRKKNSYEGKFVNPNGKAVKNSGKGLFLRSNDKKIEKNIVNDNKKGKFLLPNGKASRNVGFGKFLKPEEKKGKFLKFGTKSVKNSGNGLFLKPENKNKNNLKRTVTAIGLAATLFLGMFVSSNGKKDNKNSSDYSTGTTSYEDYTDDSSINVETEIEKEIVYEENTENITNDEKVIEVEVTNNEVEVTNNKNNDFTFYKDSVNDTENTTTIKLGDIVTFKENSPIYGNQYNVAYDVNYQKPSFDASYERYVIGVVYNLNGNIGHIYQDNYSSIEEAQNAYDYLLEQGAKVEGYLVIRCDFVDSKDNIKSYNGEGLYRAEDALKKDNSAKVRVRMINN